MRRRAPLEMKLTKNDRGRGRERGRERDREIDREGEKKTVRKRIHMGKQRDQCRDITDVLVTFISQRHFQNCA